MAFGDTNYDYLLLKTFDIHSEMEEGKNSCATEIDMINLTCTGFIVILVQTAKR